MLGFFFKSKNKNPGSVKRPYGEIEFQEVLLDSLAQKTKGQELAKIEKPLSDASLWGLRAALFAALAFLFLRMLFLQTLEGNKYGFMAEGNYLARFKVAAARGVIYDKNMTQLVFNKPSFDLMVDKRDLAATPEARKSIINKLAATLGLNADDLYAKIEEDELAVKPVAFDISHESMLKMLQLKNEFPGFYTVENATREYVDGFLFAHVIGYTGKITASDLKKMSGYHITDSVGRTGLERFYEEALRGRAGFIQDNADGLRISDSASAKPPVPGQSLVLTLDAGLQKKITESLGAVLQSLGVKKASAVALDPRTGGVLAMVSLPAFDNNDFAKGLSAKEFARLNNDPLNPLFPRAISGQYPTGSTIKPLIAAAALEEHIVSENTRLFAPLELCLRNIYSGAKECYEDWIFHGWTDVKRAIAESINPFFYIIGGGYAKNEYSDPNLPAVFEGLGIERIKRYLTFFGWGAKTGLDLAGEAEGRLPDPAWKKNYFSSSQEQIWRLGDTYNVSIGQGYLLATPLQVVYAFSALANGGILYRPHLVQEILDSEGNVVQETFPEIIRQDFIAPENLAIVREGMRQAVLAGSATFLAGLPVSSAAKTGTAQISANSDKYENWLTVFAPYDNPEIVLTILVEDVRGLQAAALPVAREALEWYFSPK